MRVRTPWIQALREKKEAEKNPQPPQVQSVKPDLTPKKMSDSYVSLVLPLSVSTIATYSTFPLANG
jgi:acyl-coenzyme A thioesterase 9